MSPRPVAGRLVVLMVLAAAWLLGVAGPASAHPALVSSQPGAGYAVTDPPAAIALAFNEPVTLPDRPLTVVDGEGSPIQLRVTTAQGGAGLVGTPVTSLTVGAYEVTYRVIGQDGDLISGTFAFGVATPVGAAGASGRAGVAGGGAPETVPLGTTVLRGLLAGFRGAGGLLAAATGPGIGRLLALQAVLLALAVLAARRPGRGVLAGLMLLLVVGLEGARAHPGEADGPLGAVLTVTHFLAGALWLGGLVHVLRLAAAWRGRPKAVRVATRTYARNALVLFVIVSATGTVSALRLLPSVGDWTGTTYGRLLLVKIAAFLFVAGLAVAVRRRLRVAAPAPSASPRAVTVTVTASRQPFGRVAALETAALAAVVLAAAAVTTVTPARLVPVSALLAAPVGPTVRVAERARQVSVSVVASQGRVEIRADAPDDGTPARVWLSGRAAAPSGAARDLDLDSCGPFCWTGPVDWIPGTSVLALVVTGDRYDAGSVSIPVPWPAVPAPGLLRPARARPAHFCMPGGSMVRVRTRLRRRPDGDQGEDSGGGARGGELRPRDDVCGEAGRGPQALGAGVRSGRRDRPDDRRRSALHRCPPADRCRAEGLGRGREHRDAELPGAVRHDRDRGRRPVDLRRAHDGPEPLPVARR